MKTEIKKENTKNWEMILGDCIEQIDQIKNESIGLSIFSPPFPAMYAYTDMEQDLGNVRNMEDLIQHFKFLSEKLILKLMNGRNCVIHLTQMPAFKRDYDYIGLKDFRGEVIKMMENVGWIYYSEVTIDKNPQIKAIRTKDNTLTFTGLYKDSSKSRPAMADYLLIFKKKGENVSKIQSGNIRIYNNPSGWITDADWKKWACPVWYDIKETDVLNVKNGRDEKDEKHLCPLQLEVIRRSVLLWTNPEEIVFSPFAGIGSEGYVSIENNRKFIGIELKESYYNQAIKNLKIAENNLKSKSNDLLAEIV